MHSLSYAQRPHFSRIRSERLIHALMAAWCALCITFVTISFLRSRGTGFVVGWAYITVLTLFAAYALIKCVRSTGVWALWITDDHLHLSVPNEPERMIELANIEFIMKAIYGGGNARTVKRYLLLRDGGHVEIPKQLSLAYEIRRAAPHVEETNNDRHHHRDPARATPRMTDSHAFNETRRPPRPR